MHWNSQSTEARHLAHNTPSSDQPFTCEQANKLADIVEVLAEQNDELNKELERLRSGGAGVRVS